MKLDRYANEIDSSSFSRRASATQLPLLLLAKQKTSAFRTPIRPSFVTLLMITMIILMSPSFRLLTGLVTEALDEPTRKMAMLSILCGGIWLLISLLMASHYLIGRL